MQIMTDRDPLYYRLHPALLDQLFEEAYQRWTPIPLVKLGIPAGNLADEEHWHKLRAKLYNAARTRRYGVWLHWNQAAGTAEIMTRASPYAQKAPRHISGY